MRTAVSLAALLLLAAGHVFALSPSTAITQYGLDSWTPRDGLPASPITGITQTRDGYVWVTTKGGVARFDGVGFTLLDLHGVPGLKRKLMWSCAAGRDGELWAGAEGTGVLRYKDGEATVLAAGEVWYGFVAVHEAGDGALWAGNVAWGLVRFRDGRPDFRTKIDLIRTIIDGPDGAVWVGTWGSGLFRVAGETVTQFGEKDGLDETLVSKLAWGRGGVLWVGTRGGLFALKDGRFRKFTTRDGLPHDDVRAVLEDRDGNLWIGTGGGGLARYREGTFSVWRKAEGMIDDQILALYEDDEGGVWIGGRGSLARIRDTNFKVYTTAEGLRADTIVQAQPAQGGGVWISTYGGGVSLLKDNVVTAQGAPKGLPNDYVGPIHQTQDGTLWMGVGSNELVAWRDGRVTRLPTGGRYVKSLTVDDRGLVLGLSRSGLHRVANGRVVPYVIESGGAMDDMFIHTLHYCRRGALWIGSNKGFARVRKGRLERFTTGDGLSGADVYSVLEDPDGTLWLGTGSGLERFKDGRGTRFDGHRLLSDNSVFTILEDASGHLWFNSNDGIVRVSKQELVDYAEGRTRNLHPHVFGGEEGLRLAESTLPTVQRACRTSDGRMWFPTSLGIASVDPEAIVTDRKVPPVRIESVVVDGRAVRMAETVELPPGTEKVEIHYTGLSYTRPERATFKFVLQGFDGDFVDAGTKRVAHYTKLPPGRYRFLVRGANSDGVWNEAGAGFRLVQQPRLHETASFRFLAVLATASVLVAGHRWRVRRLEQRERDLARKVEDAVAQIKVLRGFLPICAHCKKIRNDEGLFIQIESYIREHSHAEFSHSICPECMAALYPTFMKKDPPPE